MNSNHDDQLDQLLENWGNKKNAACAKDLATLRQRVVERLDDDSAATIELQMHSTSTRSFLAAGLAAAAILLVSVGIWRYSLEQPPTDNPLQLAFGTAPWESSGTFEGYWAKHLRHQGQLLTECNKVYQHRVAWVAETEQNCDIGLATTDAGEVVSNENEYVVIQFWLVANNPKEGQPKVHTITVLASREEWIEIPATIGGGPLALWAYPIGDGMISIDLRYQPASVVGIEIDGSNLQRIGQVTNIHSFEQDGIEYRLYQTADLIDDKDLG